VKSSTQRRGNLITKRASSVKEDNESSPVLAHEETITVNLARFEQTMRQLRSNQYDELRAQCEVVRRRGCQGTEYTPVQ